MEWKRLRTGWRVPVKYNGRTRRTKFTIIFFLSYPFIKSDYFRPIMMMMMVAIIIIFILFKDFYINKSNYSGDLFGSFL